jgi:hypothetical protein
MRRKGWMGSRGTSDDEPYSARSRRRRRPSWGLRPGTLTKVDLAKLLTTRYRRGTDGRWRAVPRARGASLSDGKPRAGARGA